MDVFPYAYRPGQEDLVGFINGAVRDRRSAVVEAGTGTGKTVAALSAVLGYTLENGMKVIYLTRTKSQQKQVVRECAAIGHDVMCVAVQGRSASSCPMMRDDPELLAGSPEEISKLCSEYKRMDKGGCRCPFYARMEDADIGSWVEVIRRQHPEPEEFARMCVDAGLCPYETVKYALPHADVIAVPYPFVFMPQVLDMLVQWIGVPLISTVMIVDEAHNLPDYLREVQTYDYSAFAMHLAEKEARDHGDFDIHEGITVADVASVLQEILESAAKEYLIDDDGMLPPYLLEEELMSRLGVTSNVIRKMCKSMEEIGDSIIERRKQKRRLPRSYIHSMALFLRLWMDADEATRVNLVVEGDGNPRFESYCMDPSTAAYPLNECFCSVHMSGTLQPLQEYVSEIGLDRVSTKVVDSLFPEDNLLTLYSPDVTMKFADRDVPENYGRIMDLVVGCVSAAEVNTAVFFPSYGFMDRMVDDGLVRRIGRNVFYERRGMPQSELMEVFEEFKASEGSVLMCVTGGRISEGLDFPDRTLEMAIIVGVPFPKPNAKARAMRRYYDIKFGDGLLYTSKIPAVRRMRQAIGRLIRSETDRGVAVILDRRVASLDGIDALPSEDPPFAVRSFFGDARQGS